MTIYLPVAHIMRHGAQFEKDKFKAAGSFCFTNIVRLDIETKFPYFLFLTWLSIIRNQEFRLYI